MIGFRNKVLSKYLWLLVADRCATYLLQAQRSKEGRLQFIESWCMPAFEEDGNVLNKVSELIPYQAKVSIALTSQFFQFQQFQLDRSLSSKEQVVYLKSQMANALNTSQANVVIAAEPLSTNSNSEGRARQSVLAADRTNTAPFYNLLKKQKLRCIRFESLGVTLAWLAFQQLTPKHSSHWGVIECSKSNIVIFVFSGEQLLCQKVFALSAEAAEFIDKLKQKLSQILTLLNISSAITVFVSPFMFSLLRGKAQSGKVKFERLAINQGQEQGSSVETELAFYAQALGYKTLSLR